MLYTEEPNDESVWNCASGTGDGVMMRSGFIFTSSQENTADGARAEEVPSIPVPTVLLPHLLFSLCLISLLQFAIKKKTIFKLICLNEQTNIGWDVGLEMSSLDS